MDPCISPVFSKSCRIAPSQRHNGAKKRQFLKQKLSLWQGQKGSNPRPTVLETAALPAELYPYLFNLVIPKAYMVGLQGLEPGTDRL